MPTCYFVNWLLEALRSENTKNGKVTADITYFLEFLSAFNGTVTYDDIAIELKLLETDTCLTPVGGIWNISVYSAPIRQELTDNPHLSITHFEMVNVLVAMPLWGY